MAPQPGQKNTLQRMASFLLVMSLVVVGALIAMRYQKIDVKVVDTPPARVTPKAPTTPKAASRVSEDEVHALLDSWGEGIVAIGEAKLFGRDYRATAADFIDRLYAYGTYPVLFKPSRAAERQFRSTREGALSYFVGGNEGFKEDTGFALNPWQKVRFETDSVSVSQDGAVAMGAYYFVDMAGQESKAEFTIGVRYDSEGRLRIILHHSSLPYLASAPAIPAGPVVTEDEVKAALKAWGDAVVDIGRVKTAGGDYKQRCAEAIDTLYGYDVYPVLFKPTKAADQPFRSTFEGALSYFVGGNPDYPEDTGFAITPWKAVRFDTTKISLHESSAIAMGSYYFADMDDQEEVKAEFTFGFRHDGAGRLRIVLHHSSLPYSSDPRRAAVPREISHEQVRQALKDWGDYIVGIGKVYRSRGDYRQKAAEFIDTIYGYDYFPVLFKPSRAKEQPFRNTREGALSYFVGGNADFPEDTGFAITPWRKVVFHTPKISAHESSAMAMGTYEFTDLSGEVTKAEFTFGFRLDDAGTLRIIVHHSSLPFVEPVEIQKSPRNEDVTKDEVLHALKEWGESIVEIGRVFQQEGDYNAAAAEMVDRLYAYDVYPVLFKPTKAAWHPFRPTRVGAISYFVGGHLQFPEDTGFALMPWKIVRIAPTSITLHGSSALAMGTYEFTDMHGQGMVVEFTIGFRHDDAGNLRIVLHHSSLPYGSPHNPEQ